MHGHAVGAHLGRRAAYRPLNSPLCRNGEVLPLVERLCGEFGFERLYLADLDAIQALDSQAGLLELIATRHPRLELWIDAGFGGPTAVEALGRRLAFRPVIGSESWRSGEPAPGGDSLLSIDSDASGLLDPSGIVADTARRPRDLILMNLSRVGGRQGPDLDLLRHWQGQAAGSRLYAAGGVRDRADLQRLQSAGAAGVLLSSALHAGSISASDLSDFS